MTDNDIIKAYGCCYLSEDECGGCDNCPYKIEGKCNVPLSFELEREVFNLLNRQKAEIERQREHIELLDIEHEAIRNKAIKEFAERIKEHKHECGCNYRKKPVYAVTEEKIDNLVKEMVGDESG